MDEDNQRLLAELQEQNAELRQQMAALQRSHHLLQAVVEGTTDAVFVKDLRGRYLMANSAALNFAGKSIEEVLGHDDTLLFSAVTARQIMERDRRIMESGQTQTEEEVGTAAGQTRTYLSTKGPYRDEQGRVIGLIGISRDVTESKRLERQSAERERRLQTILDSEPECVKTLAADGTLLEMNRAGLAMLEADASEQVCGQCIYPLVTSEYRPAFQALTERVFCGESGTLEFEGVGLKGHRLWLETHATPLRDDAGQVTSSLSITRDITERKQAEIRLRDSEQRFSTLYRVSPVGTCITRLADGVFFDVNPAFAQIVGYTREELLGRSSLAMNCWLDPADRSKLVQALVDNGSVRDWEVSFRRKNGSIGLSLRSFERLNLDGEDCILTTLSDITERKRME